MWGAFESFAGKTGSEKYRKTRRGRIAGKIPCGQEHIQIVLIQSQSPDLREKNLSVGTGNAFRQKRASARETNCGAAKEDTVSSEALANPANRLRMSMSTGGEC
jgi:hypothetical protein